MQLNFSTLADSAQKTVGHGGTCGTPSNGKALRCPTSYKKTWDTVGQTAAHAIKKQGGKPEMSHLSHHEKNEVGRCKPSIQAVVPPVPLVPPEKHNNEIAHDVSDKRAAAVASIDVSTPVTTDTTVFGNDDRRYCDQCLNLHGSVCSIARPGGLVSASKGYRPVLDLPHRCNGFKERTTL